MRESEMTSDKAYENAIARRFGLETQIKLLRSELRVVCEFIDQWNKFAGVVKTTANLPINFRRNSKKEDVAEAAREIIKQANQILPCATLLGSLVERGLVIEGRDPKLVLSTMLWRTRDKIVRLPKGGYWVADLPSPDGRYLPPQRI